MYELHLNKAVTKKEGGKRKRDKESSKYTILEIR